MLSILAVLLIIYLASTGYGYLWNRMAHPLRPVDRLNQYLIGFSSLATLALALSCFVPLGGAYGIGLLALGVAGGLLSLRDLRFAKPHYLGILSLTTLTLWLVWLLATSEWSGAYDTDLYHFNAVKWMREQGTPLGLANLHIRLGVSSSFFALAALLEQGPWIGSSAWFMPVVFPFLSIVWMFLTLKRSWNVAALQPLVHYCLAIIPFLAIVIFHTRPELYYDAASGLICLIVVGELLRMYCSKGSDEIQNSIAFQNVCFLTAFAVTIKSSSLALSAICIFLAILHYRFKSRLDLTLAAAIGSVHFLRTVLLTGWIFFPAPWGRLPFSWSVPTKPSPDSLANHAENLQTVQGQFEIIKAWARLPGPDFRSAITTGWDAWWPTWSSIFVQSLEFKLLVTSMVLLVFGFKRQISKKLEFISIFALGIVPIVLWFLSAPDRRFGAPLFWILFGLTVAYQRMDGSRFKFGLIIAAIFLVISQVNIQPVLSGKTLAYELRKATALPTKLESLNDNVQVFVPLARGDDRCGNSELPCTPYSRNKLSITMQDDHYLRFEMKF